MPPRSYITGPTPVSLWRKTAVAAQTHPALNERIAADVTVIGGGFTGLRAALELAQAGVRVVVLEADEVGFGASGRSGGQVNPMLPHNTPDQLRKILGTDYFERLAETSLQSADALFAVIKAHRIDCDARQHGWLRAAHAPGALRDAKAGVAAWNAFGAGMQIIEGDALAGLTGSPAYRAAVLAPKGGAVNPLSLTRGLARAATALGAVIYAKSPVTGLDRQAGKWVATTTVRSDPGPETGASGGSVTSDWVVVATNGYTGNLIPKLPGSILPVTSIQIATDPLRDSVIGDILPGGHTISDSRRVVMYARREPDNRMVYGGHGRIRPNGEIVGFEWLQKDALRVFPQLKGVDWTYRWGGRVAVTEDHLPHLHEPEPGLLIGLGYNGRGVAMANVMGDVMAQRVLGKPADALPFPVGPIKPFPMRALTLAAVDPAVWFMHLRDSFEARQMR